MADYQFHVELSLINQIVLLKASLWHGHLAKKMLVDRNLSKWM
uniref:Uncharacterized protein n=1 Tax=Anguilla anguilla TaxID=7936 RepID=A0A0E9RVZ0_ANGAN